MSPIERDPTAYAMWRTLQSHLTEAMRALHAAIEHDTPTEHLQLARAQIEEAVGSAERLLVRGDDLAWP